MTRYPDAWTAVRGRPWRFLLSAWPWRALAYVVGSVVVGLAWLLLLTLVLGIGLPTVVLVVGLYVLAAVPGLAHLAAEVERRRLRLVLPTADDGTGGWVGWRAVLRGSQGARWRGPRSVTWPCSPRWAGWSGSSPSPSPRCRSSCSLPPGSWAPAPT
ncbi:sensor domain-containing protein [Nocardioides houyundeii]|uniref:sensor domain-containing protein n=1 Tax=Nocardioides houyundeii TaxID=2045452 RepID=UPI001F535259|nr:sensor domain-containing protein [Nocardioides houyundeii]